jgi:hypothetical protein
MTKNKKSEDVEIIKAIGIYQNGEFLILGAERLNIGEDMFWSYLEKYNMPMKNFVRLLDLNKKKGRK